MGLNLGSLADEDAREAVAGVLKKIGPKDPDLIPQLIPLLEIAPDEAAYCIGSVLKNSKEND